ncbi:hypothetical protein MHTCC0001_22420 [Flavobacteriaceae bacterium MHTCC 0001]
MLRIITLILLLNMFNTTGFAQQTGIVQYPEYGIQFTIPNNWVGEELEESYAMKSVKEKGMMLLILNELTTLEELKSEFSKPITETGLVLQPTGNIEVGSNHVTRYYTGTINGTKVKAFGIGQLNTYGHSVTMAVITEVDTFSKVHENALFTLQKSLQFNKPKVNPHFNAALCKSDLGGKTLKFEDHKFSSGGVGGVSGSYSITRIINLCPTGLFAYYGGSNVSVESENSHGHSGGTGESHGTWQFKDEAGKVYLYLNFSDGEIRYYEVSYKNDNGPYLDNTRYYALDLNCN